MLFTNPLLTILLIPTPQQLAMDSSAVQECRAEQLTIQVDNKAGDFNGMSHSGTEIKIYNKGPECQFPARPRVKIYGSEDKILPLENGTRPEQLAQNLVINNGQYAVMQLRWVSSPVYNENKKLKAITLSVDTRYSVLKVPLAAEIYIPADVKIGTFEQTPLRIVEGRSER